MTFDECIDFKNKFCEDRGHMDCYLCPLYKACEYAGCKVVFEKRQGEYEVIICDFDIIAITPELLEAVYLTAKELGMYGKEKEV